LGAAVVPEGLNDNSQAIYCLERLGEIRPAGNGLKVSFSARL